MKINVINAMPLIFGIAKEKQTLSTRLFRYVTARQCIRIALAIKHQFNLPSLFCVIHRRDCRFHVFYQSGIRTIEDAKAIPTYDMEDILADKNEDQWVFCLLDDGRFMEIEMNLEENEDVEYLLGYSDAY